MDRLINEAELPFVPESKRIADGKDGPGLTLYLEWIDAAAYARPSFRWSRQTVRLFWPLPMDCGFPDPLYRLVRELGHCRSRDVLSFGTPAPNSTQVIRATCPQGIPGVRDNPLPQGTLDRNLKARTNNASRSERYNGTILKWNGGSS